MATETVIPKNEIEKRKGKFLFLKENTDLNQKEIAEKIGISPATANSYNKQYKKGKLNVQPIKVDLKQKKAVVNMPIIDKELAQQRKANFKYLVENTKLLQKDMADVIGVSKAAIGKYNKAYKNGKMEGIEPIKPEGLEKYITPNNPSPQEESKEESAATLEATVGTNEAPVNEEGNYKEDVSEHLEVNKDVFNWLEDDLSSEQSYSSTSQTLEKLSEEEAEPVRKSMRAAVIETSLESASSLDITSILELYTKQLDPNAVYDLKVSIRKK